MMQESSVLEPDEQDQLGMTFANLEMTAGLYETSELTAKTAQYDLALIDKATATMQKYGLLHGPIEKPWESDTNDETKRAG
jgi:hypothetical protein